MMSVHLTAHQVWGMPIALGAVSVVGLLAALLGDGVWDVVSWSALSLPIAVILSYVGMPHRQSCCVTHGLSVCSSSSHKRSR